MLFFSRWRLLSLGLAAFVSATNYDNGTNEESTCNNYATEEGQCLVDDVAAHTYYSTAPRTINIDPYGVPQQVGGSKWRQSIEVVERTKQYMKVNVWENQTMRSVRDACQNQHHLCSFWAGIGNCEKNPEYMLLSCAPACQSCHHLSFEYRCPFDEKAPTIWKKGDLNKMFQYITTDPTIIERFHPEIHSKDPWIVTLENFATAEQCEAMIQAGHALGYERSMDVGGRQSDGTYTAKESQDRTSSNAWCINECYENPHHQQLLQSVENITGIPSNHSEHWQLLRYEQGEFYGRHHDFVPFHLKRSHGPRILTVFLYLNDVPAGGGTRFTDLNITVQPKLGRALLWPSVLNNEPDYRDRRVHHEALKVLEGVKYGANAWLHLRDYKTPFANRCTS